MQCHRSLGLPGNLLVSCGWPPQLPISAFVRNHPDLNVKVLTLNPASTHSHPSHLLIRIMQSSAELPTPRCHTGVHALLKALGLRTCNSTEQTPTRAVFGSEPVNRLYKHEIPALFGILCRDEGTILDIDDPLLFDKDLDKLLLEFDPLIWPKPGEGDRNHLHEAQPGTPYDTDLWYPRDAAVLVHLFSRVAWLRHNRLKQRLPSLILAKKLTPATDVQALIEKRHKDANVGMSKRARSSATNISKSPSSVEGSRSLEVPIKAPSRYNSDVSDNSESGDSVIGTTTRRRAFKTAGTSTDFSSVELRPYRKTSSVHSSPYRPVLSYKPMFLTLNCTSSLECFDSVRQHIGTECSSMIFQLPEDMSPKGSMRLDRESGDAEDIFQSLIEIFRTAKKFPGKPQYRSVEVELGLDMPPEN
jgi:hypothetical protein